MTPLNPYGALRAAALAASFLHESREGMPGEHLLHLVWQHQRLQADTLRLTDGRPIRILHPGFWNRGAGPDFRDAVIRIGADPARSGDVEIDLRTQDWRAHQHHSNPRYCQVMLHVVWESHPDAGSAPRLPELPLAGRLDASLPELLEWIDLDPGLPEAVIGRCAAIWCRKRPEAVLDLLEEAGLFRLARKSAEFAARARTTGWEQALWEGLGAALGYEHNTWPMRRLAEHRAVLQPANATPVDLLVLQARLLGCSGLLPHEPARSNDPTTAEYLRCIWSVWWRERDALSESTLPAAAWKLGGTRPANHPQRRLALLAHWMQRTHFIAELERWYLDPPPARDLSASLLEVLQARDDPFWTRHWTLAGSAPMPSARPLLGITRAADLAVNVILPWFHARATAGGTEPSSRHAVRRYLAWPAGQDNAVLRLAHLRLFGGRDQPWPWTAARQQGLLQVARDFCGHSNALCDACVLPDRLHKG